MSAKFILRGFPALLAGLFFAAGAFAIDLQPMPAKRATVATTPDPAPASRLKPAVMAPVVQPAMESPQMQLRLQTQHRMEVQRLINQQTSDNNQRVMSVRAAISSQRSLANSIAANMADCMAGPKISNVTPNDLMPGDPVLLTGCGFEPSTGMVLLSDNNRQLTVTSWSNTAIEAVIPPMTGFADPKNVTISVVTVSAKKSAPSATLTLKPTLVLKEIVPLGVLVSGCNDSYSNGFVHHRIEPNEAANCKQGTDTVKFGIQLKNNWTYHSLVFDKLCTASYTSCGGANNAAPTSSVFQLGKSYLPDLPVGWLGYIHYYTSVMVMGPEGTAPN